MSCLQETKNILTVPFEERIDAIVRAKDPAALVASMAEEDVWLTIKKVGEAEALQLIELTTKEQLQYILDLEIWKKDRFLPDRSIEWLDLLKACGEKKVLQWAHEMEIGEVILTFKEYIHVIKKESQEDDPLDKKWPGKLSPMTFDGVYYFQCLSEKSDEVVRPILDTIVKDNYEFFAKLCESVICEQWSNLQEEAFSWRAKRLADKGFAPLEEALQIYARINERQLAGLPKRGPIHHDEPKKNIYPLALGGENYPVLMLALANLKNDALQNDIFFEMATLANKALIADGRMITPDSVEDSLKKVMGYTNIGLEILSGGDPRKAAAVLNERWLIHLFQLGFSQIAKVKQEARRFMKNDWPSLVDENLSLLADDLAAKITGVLHKRPLYFSAEKENDPYREFKSFGDVREVEKAITQATYIGRMFKDVFKLSPADIVKSTADREYFQWGHALLTIWAKGSAAGQYKFSPLTEKEFAAVLKKAVGKKDDPLRCREIAVKFSQWLLERQPNISQEEEKSCRIFVEGAFEQFFDEFSELPEGAVPDWRFVQSVWIIPQAG